LSVGWKKTILSVFGGFMVLSIFYLFLLVLSFLNLIKIYFNFYNFRCANRYTHANRTCPLHPYHKPQRSAELVLQPTLSAGEDPAQVSVWLENYRRERVDKTPAKIESTVATPIYEDRQCSSPQTPNHVTTMPRLNILMMSPFNSDSAQNTKRFKTKRGLASELEQENVSSPFSTPLKIPHLFPTSPFNRNNINIQSPIPAPLLPRSPIKNCALLPNDLSTQRRSALGDITPFGNDSSPSKVVLSPSRRLLARRTPPSSPIKTLNLKKRWLKEVVQEQNRQTQTEQTPVQQQQEQPQQQQPLNTDEEPDSENLALPIRWNENDSDATTYAALRLRRSPLAWSAVSALVEMAEQNHMNNQPLNLSTSKNNKC
jgi:hypothetical protein